MLVGDDGIKVLVTFFFFNDTATTEIYTLSLHDALPICWGGGAVRPKENGIKKGFRPKVFQSLLFILYKYIRSEEHTSELQSPVPISYAVFCLKKKKVTIRDTLLPTPHILH